MCDLVDCVTEGIMEWSPEFHMDHGLCGEWTCTPVCFCKFLLHDSFPIHFSFSFVCVISSTALLRELYGVIYLKSTIPRGSWSLWWVNLYPIMFLWIPPAWFLPFTLPSPTYVWSRRLKGLWSDLLGVQNSTWIMVFVVSRPALQYVFVNSSCMIPSPFTFPSPLYVWSRRLHYWGSYMEWSTWSPQFHVDHGLCGESTCTLLCFCEFLLHDSSHSLCLLLRMCHLVDWRGYGVIYLVSRIPRGSWSLWWLNLHSSMCLQIPPAWFLLHSLCLLLHMCDLVDCVTEGIMEWSPEFHVDHGLCGEWTCTPVCFCEFLLHDSSSIHFSFSYVCVISLTVLLRGLWSGAQNSTRIMVFVVSESALQYVFANSSCMIPPPFTLPSPTYVWSRRLKGLWSDLLVVQNSTWSIVFVVSQPVPHYVFVNSFCMIPPPFTLPSPTYVWSHWLCYWGDYGVEPRIPHGSWSLWWVNLYPIIFL